MRILCSNVLKIQLLNGDFSKCLKTLSTEVGCSYAHSAIVNRMSDTFSMVMNQLCAYQIIYEKSFTFNLLVLQTAFPLLSDATIGV